ncbi:MAG: hypothetical protein R3C11_16500 [Planctomycetaceae bacterium]
MQSGIEILRVGGTMVAGRFRISDSCCRDIPEEIVRRMIHLTGVHNYAPEDLATAIQFLEKSASRYPFASLVGESFPLTKVTEAFAAARTGRSFRVKVAIEE